MSYFKKLDDDEWDELCSSNEGWFDSMMYNVFGVLQATAFVWLTIIGVVVIVLFFGWLNKKSEYKSVEGHTYVRTGRYDYSHSHTCWCKTQEKYK